MKINWENMFTAIGWVALVALLVTGFAAIWEPKTVTGYSLSAVGTGIVIEKNIQWDGDQTIPVDRNMSLSEVVRLIDSLNHTIKH